MSSVRWKRVAPLAFVTYSLAYFDRVNYGFGAAGGLADDLRLSASSASLLSALFFLGYLAFQIPGTIYAERRSVTKLIFWCTLAWGILASCTGIVRSFGALLCVRFLLGVAEAAVMPAMLVYLSRWFSRGERSRANTYLILGNPITVAWMSVVSGYLVHALGWRWMFILEGIPAIAWAFVWRHAAKASPEDAPWLPANECATLKDALAAEQTSVRSVAGYREAFRSPQVLLLAAQYFFWSVGVYGFVLWLPSIIKDASRVGIVGTGWLSSLPFLLAAPAMLAASLASDRAGRRTPYIWPLLSLGGLALLGSYLAGPQHFGAAYLLLLVAAIGIYAPYGPYFALVPELLPRNVAGGATALINSLGALGGFVGSYLVGYLNRVTGAPAMSFVLMGCALLASGGLMLLYPLLSRRPMPPGPASALRQPSS